MYEMKGAMLRRTGLDGEEAASEPLRFSGGGGEFGSVVTMVPGTMLIFNSRARSWYLETYW